MGIEETFLKATIHVKNLPTEGESNITQEQRLQMYGLYKRATVGKCSELGGPQPWFIQVKARAKWDAWNKTEELTVLSSMVQYIVLVE